MFNMECKDWIIGGVAVAGLVGTTVDMIASHKKFKKQAVINSTVEKRFTTIEEHFGKVDTAITCISAQMPVLTVPAPAPAVAPETAAQIAAANQVVAQYVQQPVVETVPAPAPAPAANNSKKK